MSFKRLNDGISTHPNFPRSLFLRRFYRTARWCHVCAFV